MTPPISKWILGIQFMRQALAKSERKKLRQIVGHAGISAINAHDLAIRQLADAIQVDLNSLRSEVLSRTSQLLEDVDRRVLALEQPRPWRARLRWLVTGR